MVSTAKAVRKRRNIAKEIIQGLKEIAAWRKGKIKLKTKTRRR